MSFVGTRPEVVKYVKKYKPEYFATLLLAKFLPYEEEYKGGWNEYSKDLFYFGINRNIEYTKLDSITSDSKRSSYHTERMALIGIQANDIKNWFINRYLFVDNR